MPYNMPTSGSNGSDTTTSDIIYQSTNLKNWNPISIKGNAWDLGNSYAKATGYNSADKTTTATEAWLISPQEIETTTDNGVYIKFEHVNRYGSDSENPKNHQILISSDYKGDVATATWENLSYSAKETTTKDWTFYSSEDIIIPEKYLNTKVYIAFKYTCGGSNATTWEIKNLSINKGTGSAVNPTPGTPDDNPTPSIPDDAIVKTCEEAKVLALALTEYNVPTTETYSITGYITSVVGSVSRNQQTFWMADTKDGGQVFEAYYANLPEGMTVFKVGQKVTIVGPLMNYNNTPEIKNANVTILEDASTGDNTGDGDDTPTGTSEGVSINDVTVTLTNSAATAGTETVTLDLSTLGYLNAAAVETVTFSDGTTLTFDKGTNSNAPKYYTATNGVRVYANNILTFNGVKAIASIVMTCDEYSGTKYVGNTTATVSFDGNTAVYTNASADAGTQLRVKTITITYAK